MHKILLGLVMILMFASLATANSQYCFDEAGALIDIPKGKKLVLVPKWWQVGDIYIERHSAINIVRVMVKECDSGELVISPASCPQQEQPVAVDGEQCDSGELVISPSSCPE